MKREAAISKEINAELSAGSGKKLSKAEKDERSVPLWCISPLPTLHTVLYIN